MPLKRVHHTSSPIFLENKNFKVTFLSFFLFPLCVLDSKGKVGDFVLWDLVCPSKDASRIRRKFLSSECKQKESCFSLFISLFKSLIRDIYSQLLCWLKYRIKLSCRCFPFGELLMYFFLDAKFYLLSMELFKAVFHRTNSFLK